MSSQPFQPAVRIVQPVVLKKRNQNPMKINHTAVNHNSESNPEVGHLHPSEPSSERQENYLRARARIFGEEETSENVFAEWNATEEFKELGALKSSANTIIIGRPVSEASVVMSNVGKNDTASEIGSQIKDGTEQERNVFIVKLKPQKLISDEDKELYNRNKAMHVQQVQSQEMGFTVDQTYHGNSQQLATQVPYAKTGVRSSSAQSESVWNRSHSNLAILHNPAVERADPDSSKAVGFFTSLSGNGTSIWSDVNSANQQTIKKEPIAPMILSRPNKLKVSRQLCFHSVNPNLNMWNADVKLSWTKEFGGALDFSLYIKEKCVLANFPSVAQAELVYNKGLTDSEFEVRYS